MLSALAWAGPIDKLPVHGEVRDIVLETGKSIVLTFPATIDDQAAHPDVVELATPRADQVHIIGIAPGTSPLDVVAGDKRRSFRVEVVRPSIDARVARRVLPNRLTGVIGEVIALDVGDAGYARVADTEVAHAVLANPYLFVVADGLGATDVAVSTPKGKPILYQLDVVQGKLRGDVKVTLERGTSYPLGTDAATIYVADSRVVKTGKDEAGEYVLYTKKTGTTSVVVWPPRGAPRFVIVEVR